MRTAIPDQKVKPRGGGRARKDLINDRATSGRARVEEAGAAAAA